MDVNMYQISIRVYGHSGYIWSLVL